jgi:hypothetical protein
MRFHLFTTFGTILLIGIAFLAKVEASAPSTQSRPAIPLDEVCARGIEGRLGVPLGTIATIAGEVVPNTSKAKEDSDEKFGLKIVAVNDKRLPEPELFSFGKQLIGPEFEPRVGKKFRFVAYETGGFHGLPDGMFKYSPPVATFGFSFGTHLVVLAVK